MFRPYSVFIAVLALTLKKTAHFLPGLGKFLMLQIIVYCIFFFLCIVWGCFGGADYLLQFNPSKVFKRDALDAFIRAHRENILLAYRQPPSSRGSSGVL